MKKRFEIAILASRFVVKSTLTVASRGAKSNPFALQYTGLARLPTLILWAYFFGRSTDFFNRDVTLCGGYPDVPAGSAVDVGAARWRGAMSGR
ncbi:MULTISPECIES: hypothetical protein [Halomonadaceae]|uniref:Uncharacterized protein n=1 Tax=Billgrantia aerodenitrificans TaxID=2733483 RepID=A0ABS9AMU6_9GAMM|nr:MULTISPECIES: hypothetical protein [Halomonas]MCE8023079.1 hypothetical protein [Halomonas aerodenitrificans]MCE8037811.1 hypothetical protein [Halomonas sp. MCCC 1A11062]